MPLSNVLGDNRIQKDRAKHTVSFTSVDSSGERMLLFIGIASKCCTHLSAKRRKAIRETWMQHTLENFDNVDIRFFLSHPSEGMPVFRTVVQEYRSKQLVSHSWEKGMKSVGHASASSCQCLFHIKYSLHVVRTDTANHAKIIFSIHLQHCSKSIKAQFDSGI